MKKIIQTIKQNKTFLISSHVNLDADGLCSELALAEYLRSIGKKAIIVNPQKVPQRMFFVQGANRLKSYDEKLKINYDVAIILDCGDMNRIGKVKTIIDKTKPIINIDHHITNRRFGHINLIQDASSTAEILYELLRVARCKITKKIATYLYYGMMTDTGSFRYDNTTAKTHQYVSELMRHKIPVFKAYKRFYGAIPLNDLSSFIKVLNSFQVLFKNKLIYVELKKRMLNQFSESFDLRDALFNFFRSFEGVEALVILTECGKNITRINLRSSGKVNVAKIAAQFGGGGHRCASGCLVHQTLKGASKTLLKEMRKVI